VQDQTAPNAAPAKPTLYFLKGDHGGADATARAAAPAEADPAEAAAPPEAAPAEEGAARKRRQNGPDALAGFPAATEVEFAVPQPKKKTVYILRRAFA